MRIGWFFAAGLAFASAGTILSAPLPQSGGVQASQPKFRVIRSISGSEGAQQGGSYVIRDPRTIFYVPQDHKIIVYFEWEGPAGAHHIEGMWKSPDGKTTSISSFDYDAKQNKFGGYWEMLIAENTPTGLWSLEARVDGEVTGTHAFQILAGAAPVSTVPKRFVLTSAELYQRANAATVSIASFDSHGTPVNHGLGFFIDRNRVITAFQVIDGAADIRVSLPNGRTVDTQELASWNRREDLAVLKLTSDNEPKLTLAPPNSVMVGDHCFMLDSNSAGARVIENNTIIGASETPTAGKRFSLAGAPSAGGIGSALLNEYGEVIGVLGGNLVPGVSSAIRSNSSFSTEFLEERGALAGGTATPVTASSISELDTKVTSLAELAVEGQFLPIVTDTGEVIGGVLAKDFRRENGTTAPVDMKFWFSRSEGHLSVVLTIEPKKKRKGTTAIAIYDLDNKPIGQTAPSKGEIAMGKLMILTGQVDISNLVPGVYRLDVLMDGTPVWRTFFRVAD